MGAIQNLINATASGGIADATGLTDTIALSISNPITLLNGFSTAPLVGAFGTPGLSINAANVTVDGLDHDGGGTCIQLNTPVGGAGYSNFIGRNIVVDRNGHSGGATYLYGNWTNILFEDCIFINGANANAAGTAGGRAGQDANPCVGFADGITYRGCWLECDDNSPSLGWEMKCGINVLAEDCVFRGGPEYHMSMPDCQDVTVAYCDINLNDDALGHPWAFMEQPGPLAATYTYHHNIVNGNNRVGGAYFIYLNSINYATVSTPLMVVECNTFTNLNGGKIVHASDQSGGLQQATIRNNTIATASPETTSNGTTGNVFSNNDVDGASHADCLDAPLLDSVHPMAGGVVVG